MFNRPAPDKKEEIRIRTFLHGEAWTLYEKANGKPPESKRELDEWIKQEYNGRVA